MKKNGISAMESCMESSEKIRRTNIYIYIILGHESEGRNWFVEESPVLWWDLEDVPLRVICQTHKFCIYHSYDYCYSLA